MCGGRDLEELDDLRQCAVGLAIAALTTHFVALVWRRWSFVAGALLIVGAFGTGAARVAWSDFEWASRLSQLTLNSDSPRRLVRVTGTVISTPRADEAAWRAELAAADALTEDALAEFIRDEPSVRFTLAIDSIDPPPTPSTRGQCCVSVAIAGVESACLPGDRISVLGWLRPLSVARNPGGFDAPTWGRSRGIVGSLSVESPRVVVRLTSPADSLDGWLSRWRGMVNATLVGVLDPHAPPDVRALVAASTTGASWHGLRAVSRPFAAAGVQHLVAISGFNFAILAAALIWLIGCVTGSRVVLGCALAALAILFVASIEPEVSSVRAAIMGATCALALSSGRSVRLAMVLATAAIAVTLLDPLAPTQPGFQLSFGAVVGLWLGAAPIGRVFLLTIRGHRLLAGLMRRSCAPVGSAVAAWLATTPIVLLHFGACSLLCIPCTLILTAPFGAMVVTANGSLALASVAEHPARALGWVATMNARVILGIVRFAARMPGALPPARAVTAVEDDGLWLVRVDMIDVGDGSCYLVRSRNGAALFDAGSLGSANAGSSIVVPALRALGVTRLDWIAVSHPNTDHFNAVPEAVEAFSVRRVLVTEQFLEYADHGGRVAAALIRAVTDRGAKIEPIGRGDMLRSGELVWDILHPVRQTRYDDSNDGSLVIRVSSGGFVLLLTGDSSREACRAVLAEPERASLTGVSLMELPHHGSFRPEAAALVERVASPIILQSTGQRRIARDKWSVLLADACRLVSARDRACCVEWRETGEVRVGRWTGADYAWTATTVSALPVGSDEDRPPENHRVAHRATASFVDFDLEPPSPDRHHDRSVWRCGREWKSNDVFAALSDDECAVAPPCQRRSEGDVGAEDGEALGDFVDEPFRPPDLDGRGRERHIAHPNTRRRVVGARQRRSGWRCNRGSQRRERVDAVWSLLDANDFLCQQRKRCGHQRKIRPREDK